MVRRYDYQVVKIFELKVVCQHRLSEHVVYRDIKESLLLRCVKIHRDNSVDTGSCHHICDKLRCDRIPCLCLTILPCISVIRHDCSYTVAGSSLECVCHYQKLHEIIIYRLARRLHNEAIPTSDRFPNTYTGFSVAESCYC